jgi:SPASM domain peptide maturase of grasp-with-spasm system
MKFFSLYACCIPVKGAMKSIICDLQRDTHVPVPLIVFHILTKFKNKPVDAIKAAFDNEHDGEIDEYFQLLAAQEYGFYTDDIARFPKIDMQSWYEPRMITNAIVDFAPESNHDLQKIVTQLSLLFCEAIELRIFYPVKIDKLAVMLEAVKSSSLRSAEVVVGYDPSLTVDSIIELHQHNPRLRKMTVHSAPQTKFLEHLEIFIGFTTEVISSEQCCGVVSPWYFIGTTQVFAEAKTYNSCLNRKISVDKSGNIKNCPGMKTSFGHVENTLLADVLENDNFKKIWSVNKDSIKVCQDCEFRYICQDCRAYTIDEQDPYSKPLKCKYNPYTGSWEE